jgi:hypothetical protein
VRAQLRELAERLVIDLVVDDYCLFGGADGAVVEVLEVMISTTPCPVAPSFPDRRAYFRPDAERGLPEL